MSISVVFRGAIKNFQSILKKNMALLYMVVFKKIHCKSKGHFSQFEVCFSLSPEICHCYNTLQTKSQLGRSQRMLCLELIMSEGISVVRGRQFLKSAVDRSSLALHPVLAVVPPGNVTCAVCDHILRVGLRF